MDYHSIRKFYKTLKLNWLYSKKPKCNVKLGRFARYSVALTTAVTHVDDLHQTRCNRSTAYVLQYYVL